MATKKPTNNATSTNGKEQAPADAWSELVDKTMAGYPATQAIGLAGKNDKEDPWTALVERLWEANPYSNLLPIDPGELLSIFQQIWLDALRNPGRIWNRYAEFAQQYTQLMFNSTMKFWGLAQDVKPVIEPEKGDKRFSAPDWEQNPVFDAIKQGYLLAATTLLKTASEVEGLDERKQRKVIF